MNKKLGLAALAALSIMSCFAASPSLAGQRIPFWVINNTHDITITEVYGIRGSDRGTNLLDPGSIVPGDQVQVVKTQGAGCLLDIKVIGQDSNDNSYFAYYSNVDICDYNVTPYDDNFSSLD